MIEENSFRIVAPSKYKGEVGKSQNLLISCHGLETNKRIRLHPKTPPLRFFSPQGYALDDTKLKSFADGSAKVAQSAYGKQEIPDYHLNKFQKSSHGGPLGWVLNKGRGNETQHDVEVVASGSANSSEKYMEHYEKWIATGHPMYQSGMKGCQYSMSFDVLTIRYHPFHKSVNLSDVLNYLKNKKVNGKTLFQCYSEGSIYCAFCRVPLSAVFDPKQKVIGWDAVKQKVSH